LNIITVDGLGNFTDGLKYLIKIVSLTLDFNNNYTSLDTIELKHLSSLKNLRKFTFDISANKLNNSIMISLSELFKELIEITELKLDLSYGTIDDVGAYYLTSALENLEKIEKFMMNLSYIKMTDLGAIYFYRAVQFWKEIKDFSVNFIFNEIQNIESKYKLEL